MPRKVKGVTNDTEGNSASPDILPDVRSGALSDDQVVNGENQPGTDSSNGGDGDTAGVSKPASILSPYTYTQDGRAVYWRLIRLRGKPYLMNTEGEAYTIELHRGYVTPEPVIVRRMDGEWALEPTREGHKPVFFNDVMKRELERAFKEMLQRYSYFK